MSTMSNAATHDVINELYLSSSNEMGQVIGGEVAEEFAHAIAAEDKLHNKHIGTLEVEDVNPRALVQLPDMWSWDYIGLYSQYAAGQCVLFFSVFLCFSSLKLLFFISAFSWVIIWFFGYIIAILCVQLRGSHQCVCQREEHRLLRVELQNLLCHLNR